MSLINDALKRAQAEKSREAQSAATVPPLEPVVTEPASSSSFVPWAAFVIGLGALAIAGGLWFKGRVATQQQAAQSEVATAAPVTSQPTEAPQTSTEVAANQPVIQSKVAAPASSAPTETTPVTPATQTPAPHVAAAPTPHNSTPTLAAATPAQTEPKPSPVPVQEPIQPTKVAATAPSPTPAETKAPAANLATAEPAPSRAPDLQAIYYRLRGPTVVINGRTLRVAESVDGAKVISIQRTSVEVFHNGEYRTLTLKD